jgi:predicted GIY-YIG superfamily endonuclease
MDNYFCGLVAQLVEQCPFKALVQGSSPCQPTTFKKMAWAYILRGDSGRHYIGSTTNLERRFKEHRRGQTHSTKRLGDNLEIVAAVELAGLDEARALEREMKRKKNPRLALALLQDRSR